MKLGFVSAIMSESSFKEVIDTAADIGYECIEVACWPQEKATRRYAGVSHINVDELDDNKIQHIKDYMKEKGVEISALAYYPNTLDPDLDKRGKYINHLEKLICTAPKFDVHTVTTFIGRIKDKTVEENLIEYEKVWKPIVKLAEENNVRIAIENCPMLFTQDQWPGGENLATTPAIWRKMFEIIPSNNLGINYDPSHFIWQHIDYIRPLYEFKDKIFHVHYKDIKLYKDNLSDVGVMAYPLDYMSPKLPGLGDVNWAKYVSALTDIRYDGYTCIEIEDKAFENSDENIKKALKLSYHYMRQFVI
jgi:sugar phosphate isomerase/epimerase